MVPVSFQVLVNTGYHIAVDLEVRQVFIALEKRTLLQHPFVDCLVRSVERFAKYECDEYATS